MKCKKPERESDVYLLTKFGWQPKTLPLSYAYQDVKELSRKVVDDVLHDTQIFSRTKLKLTKRQKFQWPTIEEFDVFYARAKIEEYIDSLEITHDFSWRVDLVSVKESIISSYYGYEVVWSQPLPWQPVPPFTASMYFTFEVCHAVPKTCQVYVFLMLEGDPRVHNVDTFKFKEDWILMTFEKKEVTNHKVEAYFCTNRPYYADTSSSDSNRHTRKGFIDIRKACFMVNKHSLCNKKAARKMPKKPT